MKHDVLLIGSGRYPKLRRGLKLAGCRIRQTVDVRLARQALRERLADLLFIDLPQETAALRLASWAATNGVPAVIVGLVDSTQQPELPGLTPPVLRFMDRSAPPAVALRVALSGLRQLKACHWWAVAEEATLAWPIIVVSPAGEVRFATPEGREALEAVCAPGGKSPIQRLDTGLLKRIQSAVRSRGRAGQVALLRRDGVLSHYEAFVRRTADRNLGVLLLDARDFARMPRGLALTSLVSDLRRRAKPAPW